MISDQVRPQHTSPATSAHERSLCLLYCSPLSIASGSPKTIILNAILWHSMSCGLSDHAAYARRPCALAFALAFVTVGYSVVEDTFR